MVLPLLKTDLLTIMEAVHDGTLSQVPVEFSKDSACCVILASNGYPGKYETGLPIAVPAHLESQVFFAGAKLQDGALCSAGGRVLGVTAMAPTLQKAIDEAYAAADQITFANAYCRRDIGRRALQALSCATE